MSARWALIVLLLSPCAAHGQRPSDGKKMGAILDELTAVFRSGFQACDVIVQARAAGDAAYLRTQLEQPRGAQSGEAPRAWQMPPEYAESLRIDYDLIASTPRSDKGFCDVMSLVAEDLHVKRVDCEKFGAARSIAVRVVTRNGGADEPGWIVSSQWRPRSRLNVAGLPLTNPTTNPAEGRLFPGLYMFRATKGKAEILRGPYLVGGEERYEFVLPVESP